MPSISSLRAALAALALAGLTALPAAQAGIFNATAYADIELLSALDPDVQVDWSNDLVLADGFASNPLSYVDNDALLEDPSFERISSTLTSVGDALASRGESADVSALLLTEAYIDIFNNSNFDAALEFSYFYGLFAAVSKQSLGTSTANAFARMELFSNVDVIVDEYVSSALSGPTTSDVNGSGSFFVNVPAGESAYVAMILDTEGNASHEVPLPATLPLLGLGLVLMGLRRRWG